MMMGADRVGEPASTGLDEVQVRKLREGVPREILEEARMTEVGRESKWRM